MYTDLSTEDEQTWEIYHTTMLLIIMCGSAGMWKASPFKLRGLDRLHIHANSKWSVILGCD